MRNLDEEDSAANVKMNLSVSVKTVAISDNDSENSSEKDIKDNKKSKCIDKYFSKFFSICFSKYFFESSSENFRNQVLINQSRFSSESKLASNSQDFCNSFEEIDQDESSKKWQMPSENSKFKMFNKSFLNHQFQLKLSQQYQSSPQFDSSELHSLRKFGFWQMLY